MVQNERLVRKKSKVEVSMANISILGEGSWGLGLAILLYNNGHHVKVWSIFPDKIEILNKVRQNETALPGVIIPNDS